jgi:hypothetical protein
VLSAEEHTFLTEHVFWCGAEHTQYVQQRFQALFPETKAPHCNAVRQLIQKFQETIPRVTLPALEAINTDREETVGYLRPHAPKSEEVHQETIPASWCLRWHSPYIFKKTLLPTPLQNYSCA